MFDVFIEELVKASDRIKSAKRITGKGDKDISAKEVHRALGELLKDTNIPSSARRHLTQMHKDMGVKAEKEALTAQQNKPGYKPLKIGEAAKERAEAKASTQAKVGDWLENNDPKQIKELGHAKQYDRDVNSPQLRSKSAEKLTGGVKQRLATGEGIAVRDKAYGQNLDFQRQLKEKEAKVRAAKGPEVVNVKANPAPAIPDEHAKDAVVSNLMALRGTLAHPDHISAVDGEIGNRIKELSSGTMKKSESFAYSANGQWSVKTR